MLQSKHTKIHSNESPLQFTIVSNVAHSTEGTASPVWTTRFSQPMNKGQLCAVKLRTTKLARCLGVRLLVFTGGWLHASHTQERIILHMFPILQANTLSSYKPCLIKKSAVMNTKSETLHSIWLSCFCPSVFRVFYCVITWNAFNRIMRHHLACLWQIYHHIVHLISVAHPNEYQGTR